MPIQTIINRSDKEIHSQNKVVKSYAQQLKSAVISTERKKAILKEMQSELLAQIYRKVEKRSAPKTKNTTLKDNDTAKSLISCSVVHTSAIRLELHTATQIQTGKIVTAPVISKSVDRSFIKTQRSTNFIRTARITYSDSVKSVMAQSVHLDEQMKIADKAFHRKAVIRNMQMKQMRLKNKKYTIAKTDSENSLVIEGVQAVEAAIGTVQQTGGMLKTAIKGTSKGVGTIHSMVEKGVKIGTAKDVGRIATSVGGGIKNIAKDTGHQLLKTKIDKSTVTDTGTETIKQGLTELRYVDNARKAVLNTARTTTKAGYAIKNMPKNTKAQVQRIKKNAQRAKKAAQKTAAVIKKILTSKAGIILLLAVALIIILILLISGFVTVIASAVTSLFSWLFSEDGSKNTDELLDDYSTSIVEYIDERQDEIDEIVDGFICDRRQYPPYEEITELNQYGNNDIEIEDNNSILAILAVLRYRGLTGGEDRGDSAETEETEIEFEFSDDEIQEVTDKFFTFEYYYTYGHCHAPYCKKNVTTTVYNEGTPYEFAVENTEYYCDVDHQWLHGEVTNHTIDEVMEKYDFTDEEKNLYEMYLAQIEAMTGDDDDV